MKIIAIVPHLAIFLLMGIPCMAASEMHLGKFSSNDLTGWKDENFKGKTGYTLTREDGRTVLKAHSEKAASGLIMKVKLDSREYPVLAWSWKVEHTLKKEDVTRKNGDDFAARIYVVFPRTFFWQTRAISKYPPAEPGALRLLAPQRDLIAIGKSKSKA